MEKFGNVVTKDEDGKIMFDFGVNKRKFRRPRYTEEERQTRRAQFAQDAKNLKESRRHRARSVRYGGRRLGVGPGRIRKLL